MSELVVFHAGEAPKEAASQGVRVLEIAQATRYSIPVGPVVAKLVYVEHPIDEGLLIPYGQFDDYLADEKYNEALRIVTWLGACEVTSQVFSGSVKDGSLEAGFKGLGFKGGFEKALRNKKQIHVSGKGGIPRDPAPLRWPAEPGFEAARIAVLHNGARQLSIQIEKSHTFSVESDLAGALKKLGFSLGATFATRQSYVYVLEARFPEISADATTVVISPGPAGLVESEPANGVGSTATPPEKKGWFR